MYPVSSLSSRIAHVSGDSSGSIKPAGTSITVALTGGRHCFCSTIRGSAFGDAGSWSIAATPTPVVDLKSVYDEYVMCPSTLSHHQYHTLWAV